MKKYAKNAVPLLVQRERERPRNDGGGGVEQQVVETPVTCRVELMAHATQRTTTARVMMMMMGLDRGYTQLNRSWGVHE